MGNFQSSVSYSESNLVTNAVTNVLMESSSLCTQSGAFVQQMDINNVMNNCAEGDINITGVSQNMEIRLNFTCAQSVEQESGLLQKFKNDLDKQISAKTEGAGLPLSSNQSMSASITKIKNNITTNIKISNVAQCVQNTIASQRMTLSNIIRNCPKGAGSGNINIRDIKQQLVASSVASCIQNNKALNKASQELENKLKEFLESSTKGIDPMSSSVVSIASIVACVVFALIVFLVLSGGTSTVVVKEQVRPPVATGGFRRRK